MWFDLYPASCRNETNQKEVHQPYCCSRRANNGTSRQRYIFAIRSWLWYVKNRTLHHCRQKRKKVPVSSKYTIAAAEEGNIGALRQPEVQQYRETDEKRVTCPGGHPAHPHPLPHPHRLHHHHRHPKVARKGTNRGYPRLAGSWRSPPSRHHRYRPVPLHTWGNK